MGRSKYSLELKQTTLTNSCCGSTNTGSELGRMIPMAYRMTSRS